MKQIICSALVALAMLVAVEPTAFALQYEVSFDLESNASEASGVQSAPGTGTANWTFSASDPVFVMVPFDDLVIPVQAHTSEYVLSDPNKGVFKFQDGKVISASRTPLDVISTPTISTRSIRPTLFVTIPGANLSEGRGIAEWQNTISGEISKQINQTQYKHFMVDWESLSSMQKQVGNLADLIKAFLNTKAYAWDVVVIGHSRGGVFAHELGQRIVGHSKISKLHLMLLDPTAATTFGDTYPTQLPAGAYGYLKYDLLPWSAAGLTGTRGDENITNYTNYGANNFYLRYRESGSHDYYVGDWKDDTGAHGLASAIQQVIAAKDNSGNPFVVDADCGHDVIQIRTREIGADLDAICTSSSCTLDGDVTFGPLGTVSLTGTVGSDGIDAAVATTLAGTSVVIRQDQIAVTQSSLFQQHTTRVNPSGITIQASAVNGYSNVTTQLGITSADVVVSIGNINIPVVSIGPLDALIPGASLFKKKWKAFKKLF